MKHVVADIETDGLLDSLTRVHSLVLRDVETDALVSCADQPGYTPIAVGLRMLADAERVYFHNGIRFDYPALRKVYPTWDMDRAKLRDTFIIAAMRWAHIADSDYANARKGTFPARWAGSHALEAWGYRLGIFKGDYGKTTDWSQWTPEMQSYCEQDTAVGRALVLHIRQHGGSAAPFDTEHRLAWYIAQQERNGVPFDVAGAAALQAKLAARRQEVAEALVEVFGSWLKPAGVHTPKRGNRRQGIAAGCPYTKLKLITFNPGSRQHIAERLTKLYGWEPAEYTKSGQPKVDDTTLKGLPDTPGVKLLLEYLLLDKRLGQIAEGGEAWLRRATQDGPEGGKLTGRFHIHGRVKQNATITHRAAHANPNLAQVPKVGKPFGAECRALYCVPPGWKMVGADASSLEARCLAHFLLPYPGGQEYGQLVVGGDVHTANMVALGLQPTDETRKEYRDTTKTWYYAFMYGSGDEKSGKILSKVLPKPRGGWTPAKLKAIGRAKKEEFFRNTPALKLLIADVQRAARKRGYLTLIDGRRTYVRSEHAALNTLLQSAGAIICKKWIVNFSDRLTEEFGPQGWTGQWAALLWVHDEVQLAVRAGIEQRVCDILVEEMRRLTEHFHWRVPLDGEAKVGMNWKETH